MKYEYTLIAKTDFRTIGEEIFEAAKSGWRVHTFRDCSEPEANGWNYIAILEREVVQDIEPAVAQPQLYQWVNSAHRLPYLSGMYLVFRSKDTPKMDYFDRYRVSFFTGGGWNCSGVTHWMPLPDAPKGQTDANP